MNFFTKIGFFCLLTFCFHSHAAFWNPSEKEKQESTNLEKKSTTKGSKFNSAFSDWFEADEPDFNTFLGKNFTAGELRKKSKVVVVDPIHITLPSFEANGCDFNFRMGGVNWATADELKEGLETLGKNAKTTLMMIAAEATTPMLSNVTKKLNDWAVAINGQSFNTCLLAKQAGQTLRETMSDQRKKVCTKQHVRGKATDSFCIHKKLVLKRLRKEFLLPMNLPIYFMCLKMAKFVLQLLKMK